jgi:murein DD-endopeptidase MepM/ murein hydrolase activator NlpD
MLARGGGGDSASLGAGNTRYDPPVSASPRLSDEYGASVTDSAQNTPAAVDAPSPPAQSGGKAEASVPVLPPAAAQSGESAASAPQSVEAAAEPAQADGDGDDAASAPEGKPTLAWPVAGEVIFPHSVDELVYNKTMGDWRTHDGIDIAGSIGAKVASAADGEVTDILEDDLLGVTVVVNHGYGIVCRYANLASMPAVKTGEKITMGAVIGSIGDTALGESALPPHLHFSMSKDGVPVDPMEFLE